MMNKTGYLIVLQNMRGLSADGGTFDCPPMEICEVYENKQDAEKALIKWNEDLEMREGFCPEIEWYEILEIPLHTEIQFRDLPKDGEDYEE